MSWSFVRRELRRQSPAAVGMFGLALLLSAAVAVLSSGRHMDTAGRLCLLLVPALLGVYAFGPDLEQGVERFLVTLPISRSRMGCLRLGVATALTLAVDLAVLGLLVAVGGTQGKEFVDASGLLVTGLLLLPVGALCALACGNTLAALLAALALGLVGPTLFENLEDFHVRLDLWLVSALALSWGSGALWLYSKARANPPLRIAVGLGLGALCLGFVPAPAYGAWRYLGATDSSRSFVRQAHESTTTVLPSLEVGALAIEHSGSTQAFLDGVAVLEPDQDRPLYLGAGHARWVGDWLFAVDVEWTGDLVRYDARDGTVTRYEAPVLQEPYQWEEYATVEGRVRLQTRSLDVTLDRVGDDLWAAPAVRWGGYGEGTRLRYFRFMRWRRGAPYEVRNLTQGTAWNPPADSLVVGLVGGYAHLLRLGEQGPGVLQHVVTGERFSPADELPAELAASSVALVRLHGAPWLLGCSATGQAWALELGTAERAPRRLGSVGGPILVSTDVRGYATVRWSGRSGRHRVAWDPASGTTAVELEPYAVEAPRCGERLVRMPRAGEVGAWVRRAPGEADRRLLDDPRLERASTGDVGWTADGGVWVLAGDDLLRLDEDRLTPWGRVALGDWRSE
ncbi:MAG: hypothetical protein R3F62_29420 [Planctomycetota bacterium]